MKEYTLKPATTQRMLMRPPKSGVCSVLSGLLFMKSRLAIWKKLLATLRTMRYLR